MSHTILDHTDEKIVLVDTMRMIVLDCLGNVALLPFCTNAFDLSTCNL